jgi:hypothetical protein
MPEIRMDVEGLKELQAALKQVPGDVAQALVAAGREAAMEITNTEGLRKYPPAGPGNSPPTPFYVRGQGTQYAGYLKKTSERLGTQFYVDQPQTYVTEVSNRASYAHYVVGDDQAAHMAAIGWRKLYDVAVEKNDQGTLSRIYQGWIDRVLRSRGLT